MKKGQNLKEKGARREGLKDRFTRLDFPEYSVSG
jgi:hypothetical protein